MKQVIKTLLHWLFTILLIIYLCKLLFAWLYTPGLQKPTRFIHVYGKLPKNMRVAFSVIYVSHSPYCMSIGSIYDSVYGSVAYRYNYPATINADHSYRAKLPINVAKSGFCHWRLAGINFVTTFKHYHQMQWWVAFSQWPEKFTSLKTTEHCFYKPVEDYFECIGNQGNFEPNHTPANAKIIQLNFKIYKGMEPWQLSTH